MTSKDKFQIREAVMVENFVSLYETYEVKRYFEGNSAQFGEQHGFAYPGEFLERFVERNIFTNITDIRTFVLGACLTCEEGYEFYDKQKETFADTFLSTEETKNDVFLLVLAAIWDSKINNKEFDETFNEILKTNEEILVAIEILLALTNLKNTRTIITKLLSKFDLQTLLLKSAPDRIDEMKSLSLIYEFLRPKKTECKSFLGILDFMIQVWRLSKKEMQINGPKPTEDAFVKKLSEGLSCDVNEVLMFHHFLFSWDKYWTKNAGIAKERVFFQWIKGELTGEKPVSNFFRKKIDNPNYSKKTIGGRISWYISDVKVEENLLFINEFTNDFANLQLSPSLISIVNHPIFTEKNSGYFVHEAIKKDSFVTFFTRLNTMQLNAREILCILEQKRLEWRNEISDSHIARSISTLYFETLITEGVYVMKTYEEWKKIGLQYAYVLYLKSISKIEPDFFVNSISNIPIEARDFLINTNSKTYHYQNNKPTVFDSDIFENTHMKEPYLSVIMETICYHSPSTYGFNLYRFYKNGVLEEAGLGVLDIDFLLQKALNKGLFDGENFKEEIAEKFMSADDKHKKELSKAIKEISDTRNLTHLQRTLKLPNELLVDEKLHKAIETKFLELEYARFHNSVRDFFDTLEIIKSIEGISQSVIQQLHSHFIKQAIESKKYDQKDIKFFLELSNLLTEHYNQIEKEKENEPWEALM
jgi:hypothetical protein